MKNLILMVFLTSLSVLSAQSVSDYKYIIIPQKFNEFEENQYKLNTYLKNLLKKKNYEILSDDVASWPFEVRQNPCIALTTDVKKKKYLLKNRVHIVFLDCEQKQLNIYEGTSSLSNTEKGYQDALNIASKKIINSYPKAITHKKSDDGNSNSSVEIADIDAKDNSDQFNAVQGRFSNGEITLTKSDLADGSFYLINEKNSQIYAQFFPSSKSGIYKVKVIDPNGNFETIGYFDGSTVEIEISGPDNKMELVQFKRSDSKK